MKQNTVDRDTLQQNFYDSVLLHGYLQVWTKIYYAHWPVPSLYVIIYDLYLQIYL